MWPLLLLKSEYRSFVLNRRNTYEHYSGYNLLKNTDLKLNVQVAVVIFICISSIEYKKTDSQISITTTATGTEGGLPVE